MSYKIIPIQQQYIPDIIAVHMQAFPSFFLTFLGPRFLKEFYASFIYDKEGMGFAAQDSESGKILGVIVGPFTPQGYFKRLLKKRWWAFCLASTTAILKNPTIIPRLFRAVFYRGEAPLDTPRSLLSSIAVSPAAQGQRIGEALVTAWINEAKKRGAKGCFLTTDADNNDKVNRFYQRLGWKLESSYTTSEGREMNRYILDFDNNGANT